MDERMNADFKAEIIRGLSRGDTTAVDAMEEIRYGRQGPVMTEVEAEQKDPPEQRTLTAAVKKLIKEMKDNDNLGDATYPAYLDEEAPTLAS